jgi:AcrR family transcriptional regulator
MRGVTDVKRGPTEPKPTRRERARATRRRIAQAALAAFSASGYAATTMDAVARDAGVAVQTVYFIFHTKAELLVAAIELAGGAPDDPAVVMERAWIGQVTAATDGPKRLSLIVEHGNQIYARVGPLLPAVGAAASIDPDVDRAWKGLEARRRDGMARIVDIFASRGELRSGLDRTVALDILFGIHRAETYLAFIDGCGWSVDRYKAWQFVTLTRQLLGMDGASAVTASRGVDGGPFAFEAEVQTFD